MTIRKTLLLAFLAISLLPALALGALSFSQMRASMQQEIESNLQSRAESVSADIDRMLFERLQNAVTWNHLQVMQDLRIDDVDKRVSAFLGEVKQRYGGVYNLIYCVDADGRVLASSDAGQIGRVEPSSYAWLQAKLPGGVVWIERPQRDRPGGPATFTIRTRIPSQFSDGELGELVLRFDWTQIEGLLDQAAEDRRGVIVADADGRVIAASSLLAPRAVTASLRDWVTPRNRAAVMLRDGAPLIDGKIIVGIDRSQGYEHFAGFGWTTMVLQPLGQALKPVHRMSLVFAAPIAGIAAICVLMSSAVASRLSRPIAALTDYTRGFILSGRTTPPPPGSGGEIGRLRDTFVQMVEDLERSREALIRASKLAALGEMSAVMAHEIRTPLGIVRSSAQVLEREPAISPEGRELVGFIASETERLNRLVSSMLDSTRARPLQLAPTAPGGLVRRCVELLNNQADARGVTIRTRIADPLPEIECDAEQLTQALLNLLLNAIQILDAGGQVDVSAHMQDDGLHIAVADNGPGIDPEYREQLFDPFVYQREGGTGLGLAIVRQIVEAHGGSVTILDAPISGGAVFEMVLPLQATES